MDKPGEEGHPLNKIVPVVPSVYNAGENAWEAKLKFGQQKPIEAPSKLWVYEPFGELVTE